mgnify:CR=1 FL=1
MSSRTNLIHCIIMVALTFGIGFIPPIGGDITVMGMKILGVFIGVLYGWTFLGFFWTRAQQYAVHWQMLFSLFRLCLSCLRVGSLH